LQEKIVENFNFGTKRLPSPALTNVFTPNGKLYWLTLKELRIPRQPTHGVQNSPGNLAFES
jgi:hypothetical protein